MGLPFRSAYRLAFPMSIDNVNIGWIAFHRVVYIEWFTGGDPNDDAMYPCVIMETIGM